MRSLDPYVRQLGFAPAGDMARLYTTLSPGIYAAMRAEGLGGVAEDAIRDTLTFIPLRQLPWRMRRLTLWLSVRDTVEGRLLRFQDFTEGTREAVKGIFITADARRQVTLALSRNVTKTPKAAAAAERILSAALCG
ncbi:hypothetical protein [Streptomyces sp. NPDC048638]|uniref:hypothetical protein n=1 Tax=Streptomyces sp. NPDC048638 TaxID=3365580 RepID=UPI0037190C22